MSKGLLPVCFRVKLRSTDIKVTFSRNKVKFKARWYESRGNEKHRMILKKETLEHAMTPCPQSTSCTPQHHFPCQSSLAQSSAEDEPEAALETVIKEAVPDHRRPSGPGVLLALLLSSFLLACVLLVDSQVWRAIRRPTASFFLTLPFLLAATLSAYVGCLAVPALRWLKAGQVIRKEGPCAHQAKAGTPTMGGLFFIPIGLLVAWRSAGPGAPGVQGAIAFTLGCFLIGLLDDSLVLLRKHNDGLPGRIKFLLQGLLSLLFCTWLMQANLPSPYSDPSLIPLPAPLLWLRPGWLRLPLCLLTLQALPNALNLTDGLDGLAAGTGATALTALAVAVLPLSPALALLGASLAGACLGFLAHNRPRAGVFMGDTGSLALGGALAAMAAISGMYLPLALASAVFVVETVSVMLQVGWFKASRRLSRQGQGQRLLRMAPFHHHLELCGLSELAITAGAYLVACLAGVLAAYVGLISV